MRGENLAQEDERFVERWFRQLPATNYPLPTTNYELRTTNYELVVRVGIILRAVGTTLRRCGRGLPLDPAKRADRLVGFLTRDAGLAVEAETASLSERVACLLYTSPSPRDS